MIIGVTGYLAAGKDTVVDHLVKQGFKHISLSDILRAELRTRGKAVTRKNLQELGNDLRQAFGPGYLAQRALLTIDDKEDWVISSIGTAGEVAVLRKNQKFNLIFVNASQKTRYKRIKARKRERDPQTFAAFKKLEAKEAKGGGAQYRAFDETKKLADIIINNDGTLRELHRKVDKAAYVFKTKRPSWDDYFIGITNAVRERGTCDRGKAGCVIAKDNRILTTGYVGSVKGMPHCDEAGHLMHEVINEDGTRSKHCIRTVHAEQNAIVQAARNGVSIDGATLYCSMTPCFTCAKLIINAGIKRVVANKDYHKSKLSKAFFKAAKVKLDIIHKEVEQYTNMK
ncbi:AAA family ATPase [Candidatus Woesearchaeota archaeon]|nr:AAA family ATPase [Candidatus Woesearchaeota archaeon]